MKKLIASIVAIVLGLFVMSSPAVLTRPVYAIDEQPCTCTIKNSDGSTTVKQGHKVNAAILTDACECGGGESIIHIIALVVNILTVGIGVVGTIGIVISGLQYLTAGGNEEQTRKAKRRIFEIVIGFAAYAVIYLALYFLLPNFSGTGA